MPPTLAAPLITSKSTSQKLRCGRASFAVSGGEAKSDSITVQIKATDPSAEQVDDQATQQATVQATEPVADEATKHPPE